MPTSFVALDFETAGRRHDSACAIGMVRVENNQIVELFHHLIRPPRPHFAYTYVHGITWADVAQSPSFREAWTRSERMLRGVEAIAAHNAIFDQTVLEASCRTAGLEPPRLPFVCTMDLARRIWKVQSASLPSICAYLEIPLNHHDSASDAMACARILMAANLRHRPASSGGARRPPAR